MLALVETSHLTRANALRVLGRITARRGEPEASALLDDMWAVVVRSEEAQTVGPARAARAEAAWLAGDFAAGAAEARSGLEVLSGPGEWWLTGELAVQLWRCAGTTWSSPPISQPHRLWLEGEHHRVADLFREKGLVYEEADALGDCDDEESLRRAFSSSIS